MMFSKHCLLKNYLSYRLKIARKSEKLKIRNTCDDWYKLNGYFPGKRDIRGKISKPL